MTSVKYFHSKMTGAPELHMGGGSMIAVLDACLVTGFGLKTVDALTVSGGLATATFSTGHSFEPDTIALFAGATPGALNGERRILSTTTNSVTFAAPSVADGAATGAISAKLAPAGWSKPFSGNETAAYRSNDISGTRMFLRIADSYGTSAHAVGYENMTDINTGTGMFPTAGQLSDGQCWGKSNNMSDYNARAWTLVADGKTFYLHVHTTNTGTGTTGSVVSFGDIASRKSGDAYACVLQGPAVESAANYSVVLSAVDYLSNALTACGYFPRSFTGVGGSMAASHTAEALRGTSGASGFGANAVTPNYPNGPDNGLILVKKALAEPAICLRGSSRGALFAVQDCHTQFSWRDKIDGQGDYAGRKLLAVKCGSYPGIGAASQGVMFFDITGPW